MKNFTSDKTFPRKAATSQMQESAPSRAVCAAFHCWPLLIQFLLHQLKADHNIFVIVLSTKVKKLSYVAYSNCKSPHGGIRNGGSHNCSEPFRSYSSSPQSYWLPVTLTTAVQAGARHTGCLDSILSGALTPSSPDMLSRCVFDNVNESTNF